MHINRNYRPDIDGLRAFAVISVVFYHAFPDLLKGGFVGVDIFFVISGFLITSILSSSLKSGNFSFSVFYANRVRRIFPALILVLIFVLTVGWFVLMPAEYGLLGKHSTAGAGFVSNFLLYSESGYFDTDSELKPLLHLWSLAIEEQFYLFYPLLLWMAARIGWSLFLTLLVFCFFSFFVNIHLTGTHPDLAFFFPGSRFWELFAGGLAFCIYEKREHFSYFLRKILYRGPKFSPSRVVIKQEGDSTLHTASFAGFLLLLGSVVYMEPDLAFPGYWAALPVLGSALLIISGSSSALNKFLFSNRLLIKIGLISYPLYIFHWPMISFSRILGLKSATSMWICIGLSVLAAYFIWRFIETPIRKGGLRVKKSIIFILVASVIGIGSCGFFISAFKGIPQRWVVLEYEKRLGKKLDGMRDVRGELIPVDLQQDRESFSARYGRLLAGNFGFFHNASGVRTVVIYGDSHAAVAYPGIAAYNASIGVNTVFFAENWRFKEQNKKEYIPMLERQVFNSIENDKSIDKVFVLSSFTAQGCETRYCIPSQKEIDVLASSGRKVYLVEDNPLMVSDKDGGFLSNEQVQAILSRTAGISHPLLSGYVMESSSTDLPIRYLKDMMPMYKPYLNELHSRKNAIIVEGTLREFCTEEICPFFDENGYPLYRDQNHLTHKVGVSRLIERVLKPYLDQ